MDKERKRMIDEIIEKVEELIEKVDLVELRRLINSLSIDELKDLLIGLDPYERTIVFRLVEKEKAEKLFEQLSEEVQSNIISKMKETAKIFEDIPLSDLAEIFDELPSSVAIPLLKTIPKEERLGIIKVLGYEEGSAGRLITPYFIKVNEDDTIKKALEKVRKNAREVDNISLLYVVDKEGRYKGVVELKDVLVENPKKRIKSIMKSYPYVFAKQDQEEATRIILEEEITEIPVVDSDMKLIGIIPSDELMETIEEEASEDIELLGGLAKTEEVGYFYSNLKERLSSRLPWLVVLLLAAFVSATIISMYSETLAKLIILAAFIPMVNGTAGNTASQVVALVVRGLATGEIKKENAFNILKEEFKTIFGLAVLLGFLGFFISFFESSLATVGIIISLSIFSVVIAANIVAFLFPFILKRFGIDPAVASGPLVTTLMDSISLLIFFNIANFVIEYFNL